MMMLSFSFLNFLELENFSFFQKQTEEEDWKKKKKKFNVHLEERPMKLVEAESFIEAVEHHRQCVHRQRIG